MTLRRRWTLSIGAILALFALNLSVYVWGNEQRSAALSALKTELERKDLLVEIRDTIEARQRDTEIIEPLVASGTVVLEPAELEEIRARVLSIEERIDRLVALPFSNRADELSRRFARLAGAWQAVYEYERDPQIELAPDAEAATPEPLYRSQYAHVRSILGELEGAARAEAAAAEQRFTRVAALTDRITLAIFAVSAGLAIAIAVWFSRFLRSAFARYVTAEVVDSLLTTPAGLDIGGEKRLITVLMADLRGFTALSERTAPEKVVAALNAHLGRMTEIIVAAGGVIDEFIGDAILVFFGAPTPRDDQADAAIVCALEMQLAMSEVNAALTDFDLPELEIGIGIHSGDAVVGNIGSTKRTKYGAVGTTVNLASRIQSYSVGGQILASSATVDLASIELRIDGQFEIRPKGLEQDVAVLVVGGVAGAADLQLPQPGEALTDLAKALPVTISPLEGARTGRVEWRAELGRLSPRAAALRSEHSLHPLEDLKIGLPPEVGGKAPVWVYAKVLPGAPLASDETLVRFTTVPPQAAALIHAQLASLAEPAANG
jgi:class 3 adenylate cyclase